MAVEVMPFHLGAQDVVLRRMENVVSKLRHVLGVVMASIGYRDSVCVAWGQRRLQGDEYATTGKDDYHCPGRQFPYAEQEEAGQRQCKLVGAENGTGPDRLV